MASPYILDCDPGHDDVFAIWLALGSPDVDLKVITTVAGNVPLSETTANALAACSVAGRSEVRVAAGASRPLYRSVCFADDIHGANGLGGVPRPISDLQPDPSSAAAVLAEVIESSDAPVTIVATGPLTNIARLVLDRPDLRDGIGRVVWMGGSTTRGNVTPYAEFNAYADPHAVDVVLGAGLSFTMVGLNLTLQTHLDERMRGRLERLDNATSRFGLALLRPWADTYRRAYDRYPAMHDPVALALAIHPGLATSWSRARVDIELEEGAMFGSTAVSLQNQPRRPANADVPLELDVAAFWDLLFDSLGALA